MHILPSRGRPQILQRYFDEGKPEQPGVIILDHDQMDVYAELKLPDNWSVVWAPPMTGFVAKCNLAFSLFKEEPWYAFGGDDLIGRTPHWDTELSAVAAQGYIAWGDDMFWSKCSHPYIYGDFCRDLGWVCHPAFKHLYVDAIWENIAVGLGIGRPMLHVKTEAHHFANKKLPFDQTAKERMEGMDADTYLKFVNGRGFHELYRKIHLRCESLSR